MFEGSSYFFLHLVGVQYIYGATDNGCYDGPRYGPLGDW